MLIKWAAVYVDIINDSEVTNYGEEHTIEVTNTSDENGNVNEATTSLANYNQNASHSSNNAYPEAEPDSQVDILILK